MNKLRDLSNMKFTRLTVIDLSHKDRAGRSYWKCKCDCGNVVTIRSDSLTSGNTKACGCLSRELSKERFIKAITKHGESKTRLFNTWCNMRDRCSAFGKERGQHYADKGITVCDEWKDFEIFKEWSLINGYKDNLTIDRINVNGNYEASNCRWVTIQVQERNRSNSIYIEYQGVNKHLKEWAKDLNVKYHTLYQRYKKNSNPDYVLFLK